MFTSEALTEVHMLKVVFKGCVSNQGRDDSNPPFINPETSSLTGSRALFVLLLSDNFPRFSGLRLSSLAEEERGSFNSVLFSREMSP